MTDTDLIASAAEKVMGWRVAKCESAYFDSYCDEEGCGQGPVSHWKPLANWNHCFEVVKAMREKGWDFTIGDRRTGYRASFSIGSVCFKETAVKMDDETAQRRAILEAALKALA